MKQLHNQRNGSRGFTIIELVIVLLVVVVLLSFGVPRYRDAIERAHAGEAMQYLADVRLAQDRYAGGGGRFASDVNDLELTAPTPRYFEVGLMKLDSRDPGWSLTLTRHIETSNYGAYSVVFNERGYDADRSSVNLLSRISPVEEYVLLGP